MQDSSLSVVIYEVREDPCRSYRSFVLLFLDFDRGLNYMYGLSESDEKHFHLISAQQTVLNLRTASKED